MNQSHLWDFGLSFKPKDHILDKNKFWRRNTMVKTKVKQVIDIPEGSHTGEIVRNEKNITEKDDKTYEYHDTIIRLTDIKGDVQLKVGVPFNISEKSALGKLLKRFGAVLKVDEDVDTDEYLKKGLKVKFLTKNKKTANGEFANIDVDTLLAAE